MDGTSEKKPFGAGHPVVSREEWLKAREILLKREKAWTREKDLIAEQRRALPWVKVEKDYVFEAPEGKVHLADLFGDKSQLVTYHFMLAPEQKEGCVGCSFGSDHIDPVLVHLQNQDVAYTVVARAPIAEIEAYKKRMGWSFRWVSSHGSDFNYDFNVSFTPEQIANGEAVYNYRKGKVPLEDLAGDSVFFKNEKGEIFHTYSQFGRGGEEGLGLYTLLDITPKGRNENGPTFSMGDWVRHHDRYEAKGHVLPNGRWVSEEKSEIKPAETPRSGGSCCH
jgi:predicted dithiol-disulfide oxidoreductase (DUF899 family)